MELDALKSLQKRIQEATGADRELDFAICKALGRAPADAVWEVDEKLPPELAKHYKEGWTTPAYVEHRREYKRGIEAAFVKKCSDAERAAEIKALDKEWDFKNSPPFGHVHNFTSDPDGLGACVALQRSVLPGWTREVREMSDGFWVRLTLDSRVNKLSGMHACETHATLLAICAALIAEEQAKEKADV